MEVAALLPLASAFNKANSESFVFASNSYFMTFEMRAEGLSEGIRHVSKINSKTSLVGNICLTWHAADCLGVGRNETMTWMATGEFCGECHTCSLNLDDSLLLFFLLNSTSPSRCHTFPNQRRSLDRRGKSWTRHTILMTLFIVLVNCRGQCVLHKISQKYLQAKFDDGTASTQCSRSPEPRPSQI